MYLIVTPIRELAKSADDKLLQQLLDIRDVRYQYSCYFTCRSDQSQEKD